MKRTSLLYPILLFTVLLIPLGSIADKPAQAQYKITALPISADDTYYSVIENGLRYSIYELDDIEPQLRNLLIEQQEIGPFGFPAEGAPYGYLFLPPVGSVQVIMALQSELIHSVTLLTVKDNQLIERLLIGFSGPDEQTVIEFTMNENYKITLKSGLSDPDHEYPIDWRVSNGYQLEADGKIYQLKNDTIIYPPK